MVSVFDTFLGAMGFRRGLILRWRRHSCSLLSNKMTFSIVGNRGRGVGILVFGVVRGWGDTGALICTLCVIHYLPAKVMADFFIGSKARACMAGSREQPFRHGRVHEMVQAARSRAISVSEYGHGDFGRRYEMQAV